MYFASGIGWDGNCPNDEAVLMSITASDNAIRTWMRSGDTVDFVYREIRLQSLVTSTFAFAENVKGSRDNKIHVYIFFILFVCLSIHLLEFKFINIHRPSIWITHLYDIVSSF